MDLFDSLYNDAITNGKPEKPLLDEAFRKQFANLHDFIVKRSHNKLKREHGRVTITAEGEHFKIQLTDPTGQCSFSMLCDDIESGLRSMENHCSNSAVHWYYWGKKDVSANRAVVGNSIGTGGTKSSRKRAAKK